MAQSAQSTTVSAEELQNALKNEKYPEKNMIIDDLKEWGAD